MFQPLRAQSRAVVVLNAHWHDDAVCGSDAPHTLRSSSVDAERCSFDADVTYVTPALHAGLSKVEKLF